MALRAIHPPFVCYALERPPHVALRRFTWGVRTQSPWRLLRPDGTPVTHWPSPGEKGSRDPPIGFWGSVGGYQITGARSRVWWYEIGVSGTLALPPVKGVPGPYYWVSHGVQGVLAQGSFSRGDLEPFGHFHPGGQMAIVARKGVVAATTIECAPPTWSDVAQLVGVVRARTKRPGGKWHVVPTLLIVDLHFFITPALPEYK